MFEDRSVKIPVSDAIFSESYQHLTTTYKQKNKTDRKE